MNKSARLALAALTAAMSGCCTIDYAVSPLSGNEHVLVTNYGWQLFNVIPIVCGNATDPRLPGGGAPWAFFRDDVTMDKVQDRLMRYAAERNKTPTDLAYHNFDTIFISIPFTGVPIPIPYLVCYREIQLSGVLK